MRAAWPADKPLSVRISATDWADGGLERGGPARHRARLQAARASISSTSRPARPCPEQQPVYGRMWQTPFADKMRNEVGIATIAVGNIFEPDHVNSIIAAGRADLCAIARPHLANPAWTLEAAARQGYAAQWWPQAVSLRQELSSSATCSAPPSRGGPV